MNEINRFPNDIQRLIDGYGIVADHKCHERVMEELISDYEVLGQCVWCQYKDGAKVIVRAFYPMPNTPNIGAMCYRCVSRVQMTGNPRIRGTRWHEKCSITYKSPGLTSVDRRYRLRCYHEKHGNILRFPAWE